MSIKSTKGIAKNTLRNEIKKYIQHQISQGIYKPGDRIVETQLAKELNVSQAPVREAILELSMMGIIEERPYSGSFVRELTPDDIEDIYNTRAFLDEYCARRAAQKVTEEELQEMEALLHEMDSAENIDDFVEKDMAFHRMVVKAGKSPSMLRIWDTLRLVEWTELSVSATKSSLSEIAKQHWEIYDLIKNHADHTAGAYMFLHIKNFGKEVMRQIALKSPQNSEE